LIPLLLVALALPGCAWTKRHLPWHHKSNDAMTAAPAPKKARHKEKAEPQPNILTPDNSLTAKVLSVNTVGRFVVLNFPEGSLPKLDLHLFLYRAGLKTAEVKVTGPQQDNSIVADLISGEAQAGDTVRDE
jgi:hypothetical protein